MKIVIGSLCLVLCLSLPAGATAPRKEKIKVAFIAGFTGSDPNTALEMWRALGLALQSSNNFEISRYDDKGDAGQTAHLTQEALAQGTQVVVGLPNSDQALVAAKLMTGRNALMITAYATNPNISKQGNNILQIAFSDDYQGELLAGVVKTHLHAQKILVLTNVESIYSIGLSGSFKKALQRDDPNLPMAELIYTKQDLKLSDLGNMIRAFQPDVIFIPDHILRASVLIKKAHEVDAKVRFLGGDGLDGRRIFQDVFKSSRDIDLYYTAHWHEGLPFAANKKFVRQYKAKFQSSPPASAALMWDATQLLIETARHMHSPFQAAEWSAYIHSRVFQSTMGPLDLRTPGKPPIKSAVLVGLKGGQYDYLKQVQ